jgi:hypothetical protein
MLPSNTWRGKQAGFFNLVNDSAAAFRASQTDKVLRESLSVEAAELILQPSARNW